MCLGEELNKRIEKATIVHVKLLEASPIEMAKLVVIVLQERVN